MTQRLSRFVMFCFLTIILNFPPLPIHAVDSDLKLDRIAGAKPRNVVFIFSDDHRYDVMGFMGHPFSPNGKLLASGSFDHRIKLWNPAVGK